MQFAMVLMNLMKNKVGDHIITGQWAKAACRSKAVRYGQCGGVKRRQDLQPYRLPDQLIDENADYVYLPEHIYGTVHMNFQLKETLVVIYLLMFSPQNRSM